VADWSAEWRGELAGRAVALGLRVENLLDRRYDVVFGFPEGGRSVSASVRYGPP
jgi:outer membrane receptor protein involved in Fe transport